MVTQVQIMHHGQVDRLGVNIVDRMMLNGIVPLQVKHPWQTFGDYTTSKQINHTLANNTMTAKQLEEEQLALGYLTVTSTVVRRIYDERDRYRNALLKILNRDSMVGMTMDQQYERVIEIAREVVEGV
jgi:hypothetical protein